MVRAAHPRTIGAPTRCCSVATWRHLHQCLSMPLPCAGNHEIEFDSLGTSFEACGCAPHAHACLLTRWHRQCDIRTLAWCQTPAAFTCACEASATVSCGVVPSHLGVTCVVVAVQAYKVRFPAPGTPSRPLASGKVTTNTPLWYSIEYGGVHTSKSFHYLSCSHMRQSVAAGLGHVRCSMFATACAALSTCQLRPMQCCTAQSPELKVIDPLAHSPLLHCCHCHCSVPDALHRPHSREPAVQLVHQRHGEH